MKFYFTHSEIYEQYIRQYFLDRFFTAHKPAFVTFETLIASISLLLVSTSSLIIYRIIKAHNKNSENSKRTYFALISLSISNIAVGLFSVPSYGICFVFCFKTLQIQSRIIMIRWLSFFIEYPISSSSLLTTVIAVDRMFLVRYAQRYESIVTLNTLKVITIILLLCCAAYSAITNWCVKDFPSELWTIIIYIILAIVGPVVVILAHLYILYFVLRRRDLKQLRIHHQKNHNSKRLTKTITFICINQIIFNFPCLCYICYVFFFINDTTVDLAEIINHWNILPWLLLLPFCQCFGNAIIILLNQKKQKKLKLIDKEQPLLNDKSRMETRL